MNRRIRRRKEINTHISLQTIKQYLLHGKYPNGCLPTDKRGIRKRCESFKLEGDDLYYISRPKRLDDEPIDPNPANDRQNYRKAVVTTREQLAVTSRAHVDETGVHKGTERTLREVSSQYYWVGMSATARQVVKSCPICLARQDTPCYDSSVNPKASNNATSSLIPTIVHNESVENHNENDITGELAERAGDEDVPAEATEPFTVTAEVEDPLKEDPALDFDVSALFSDGKNLMEDCEIPKAQRFWERVEVLLISPTAENKKKKEDGRGRHKNYTIVALDSFSKWPEARKLDRVNEQTISQFIIQLISRFGIMNQLVILENDLWIDQSLIISGITQNLSMFNIIVMSESYNLYDDNWPRICQCLSQFAQSYPTSWSSCLDLCLMPLRNSIAPKTDYTPAYVVTGREPMFPAFLFPHKDSLGTAETVLNQDQIKMATDGLMTKYQECFEADVKEPIATFDAIPVRLTNHISSVKEETAGVRKSGRKVTVSQRLADYDHVISSNTGRTGKEDMEHDGADIELSNDADDEEVSQCIPLKKRRLTVIPIDDIDETEALPSTDVTVSKRLDGEDPLNKLDSFLFYKVLKLYIEKREYPLNSPMTFKRFIRKAREVYSMENGQLVYMYKNKTKKTVLTTMKERLRVLDEIHTSTDDHIPRSRMIDLLDQKMVYWKTCGGDIDAYVKACPDCKHGKARPRGKKRIGKKYQADKDSDDDDDDWNICEKYQDRVSSFYPDLIEFLQSGQGPSHLSRSELVVFKKKARNFKLLEGELFYSASSTAKKIKGRRVLANEDQRSEVMQNAHGDSHQPPSVMLNEIKKNYYWRPMRSDIEKYVQNCCQSEIDTHKLKADELSEKVEMFARYFRGEDIREEDVDLDSLFPETDDLGTDNGKSILLDDRTGSLEVEKSQAAASSKLLSSVTSTAELSVPNGPRVTAASGSDGNVTEIFTDDLNQPRLDELSIPTTTADGKVDKSNPNANSGSTDKAGGLTDEIIEEAGRSSLPEQELDDDEDVEEEENEEDEGDEPEKGDSSAFGQNVKTKRKHGEKMRCDICKTIVRGQNNMKEHMYKHTGIKPFSCEVCNKKLTTVKGMRMHMRKHNGNRPYLCNICGRGFPRSASLRYHIKTHSKGATLPVICEVCDRVFTSEHRMKKHKLFKHPEKRPVWRCDECGKTFTAKRSLKRHEEAHQGIRRYVCTFCNRSFFRKEYLTYHMDSHYKGNPSMTHLASKLDDNGERRIITVSKRKRKLAAQRQQVQVTKEENPANLLSIYTVQPEKVYTHLVEVTNPHAWTTEGGAEVPTVFTLEGGTLQVTEGGAIQVTEGGALQVTEGGALQVSGSGTLQVAEVVDPSESGTALVMVEEGGATTRAITGDANQEMEIGHIIMSNDVVGTQQTGVVTDDANHIHVSLTPAAAEHDSISNSVQLSQDHELTTLTSSSSRVTSAAMPTTHIIEAVDGGNNIIGEHSIAIQQEVTTESDLENVFKEENHQIGQHVEDQVQQKHQEEQQEAGRILSSGHSISNSEGIFIPTESLIGAPSGVGRQIEVTMSNGQKLLLSRTDDGSGQGLVGREAEDQGEGEMVQYRLECVDGETITEEHLNAFRMLAQANTLLQ